MPRKALERTQGGAKKPRANLVDDVSAELRLAFGQGFRAARQEAGLTQADIEERTGIQQAYISEIENGKYNPNLNTMVNLALSIGQDVSTLLKGPLAKRRKKPAQP